MQPDTAPDLDQITIDLVFALRDSLTDEGPSRLEFWGRRAGAAIEAAAAGADDWGHAVSTACDKLQIRTLTNSAAAVVTAIGPRITDRYDAWAEHVARNLPYIIALANVQRTDRKKIAQ